MITLLPYEISTLQALLDAGNAKENYADAYRYLSTIAKSRGADGTAIWLGNK